MTPEQINECLEAYKAYDSGYYQFLSGNVGGCCAIMHFACERDDLRADNDRAAKVITGLHFFNQAGQVKVATMLVMRTSFYPEEVRTKMKEYGWMELFNRPGSYSNNYRLVCMYYPSISEQQEGLNGHKKENPVETA
jgi:hypothetical protein